MGFLDRLFKRPEPAPEVGGGIARRWTLGGRLEVAPFVGEILDAPAEAVRLCVEGALREAEGAGCTSVALPVFGASHANLLFHDALEAMAPTLRDAPTDTLETALLVLLHPHQARRAEAILDRVLGTAR